MGILKIFKILRVKYRLSKYKELGSYTSTFTTFGPDAYASDTARACIRALANFTSKANAICKDKALERLLNVRPNRYMTGHDFLYKVRTRTELHNTCFIYIARDDKGKVTEIYPVPYSWFQAVEYRNGLYIEFHFAGSADTILTVAWEDLVVTRKDYNSSDIAGDDNTPLLKLLELQNTVNEGLGNSIKATANLRGILKSTKAMLADESLKAQRDKFVEDYMNLENHGGIAALDAASEFIPVNMDPARATADQMREIRENVYRYYGVNDKIIMGDVKTEELENFYRLCIEPFLIGLSMELTAKIYPGKSGAASYGNQIIYFAEQGQFMTIGQKIELYNKVVLYGGLLINEWRALLGLGPIEGGDKPIMRLDAAPTDEPRGDDKDKEDEENGSEE